MKPWRIITVLLLLLLLGVDALAIPSASKNASTGFFGVSVSRARYYNPQIGRFWTRDSYEGNSSDPLSLHKYLYAHNNPVNMVDPSGHLGSAIEFGIASSIAIIVRGAWEGARAPTYAGAITAALTVALIITAADVIPDAIEKINQRRREGRHPYVRYDSRPGVDFFEAGKYVFGPEAANLDWAQALLRTYIEPHGSTIYMYTVMVRPGGANFESTLCGIPEYKLNEGVGLPYVILTRIIERPDQPYGGPF